MATPATMHPSLRLALRRICASGLALCAIVTPLTAQVMPEQRVATPDIVIDSAGIPRNSSFSLASATEKVLQQYPFAVPVQPVVPHGVEIRCAVRYRTIGSRSLVMDICLPQRTAPASAAAPAILLIHGGGWRSGDRSMELPMALQFAAHGYVAATVEYRLSPEALYPAAILDLKAAVRWLRAHAREYDIDTTRIAVYGCSSGGHLASLIGVTNGAAEYEEGGHLQCSSNVQAVIDIDGPLDLTIPEESGKDTIPSQPSAAKAWLGSTYADEPGLWRHASPVTRLHGSMPPMLFVNSALPRFHAGRDAAIDTMAHYGISHEVHTIPDTPHPFWLFKPWQPEVVKHCVAFLGTIFRR